MLSIFKEISYVKLIIPFCLGIVSYVFLPLQIDIIIPIIIFLACCILLILLRSISIARTSHRFQWMHGISISVIFCLFGYCLTSIKTEINSKEHFTHHITGNSRILLVIEDPPVEKAKSYKATANVLAVANSDTVKNVIGTVLIYLKKGSSSSQLKYGDCIWVKNKFTELPPPKNPREFNYKRFMGFKQVNRQIFLSTDDWIKSGKNEGSLLLAKVYELRQFLINVLREHISDDDSYAVGVSLILGMREKLDDELIKAYSSSGAMHVLAVSGLHVAILYSIFNSLLFFMDRNSKSKIAKSVINVSLIWLYAVLTGLSASVLRSAVMFTFVAMGDNLRRPANIYNNLASSAFFLLLINPYFLMEVGFQLSYLAVLGIVMLQPRIYPLLYTSNWLLDKIWLITAVSIAAQIATFPLGLLYYYQFPLYFLVSNLFVIPASTLVLYFGVALFALFWIPYVGGITGWLLDKTIWFMNWVVVYIDSMPFALLQGISITVPESWFLYLIVIGIVVFFYYHRNSFLIASLAAVVLLLGWNAAEKLLNMQQQKLIVYSVPKTTAIDFISGTDHLFIADSSLLGDYDRMLFHIKHNWWDSGLRSATAEISVNIQLPFLKREKQFIQFLDKRVILLDNSFKSFEGGGKLRTDFIILSKNARVRVEDLAHAFDFKKIIFDSSNSDKKIAYWKKDCERLGIEYYDVNESGAFVEDI